MAPLSPDCTVTTLVEVQGGRLQWERARRRVDELGWPSREVTPRERRTARRALDADPGASEFRWVEVPVVGSSWRADREAAWMVAELSRTAGVVVYGRLFRREEVDRVIEPEWQVYSVGRRTGVGPRRATARWLRSAGQWVAARTGLLDDHVRVHGARDHVLHLARHLPAGGARADLRVRPLDGRGRRGTVQHREDALNRALALIVGPLLAMAFFLSLAQHGRSVFSLLCWLLALACAVPAWWTAFTLPLARTRLGCLAEVAVVTLFFVGFALGVPGSYDGQEPGTTLGVTAVAFYATGLVLLGRRWRWQVVAAGVLPVVVTLCVAALPLTGRILHDAYADALSLTPNETAVSGIWRIAAAVRLLWLPVAVVLFVAAGWGILRYFHFIRPGNVLAVASAVLIVVLGLTESANSVLSSPQRAAATLERAAERGRDAPSYYGIHTHWVCVRPTVAERDLNEQGGLLSPRSPYVSFGVTDGNVVLWNPATKEPLRVPAGQVKLVPADEGPRTCAS